MNYRLCAQINKEQDEYINAQLEPFIKSEWGYEVFLVPSRIVIGGGGGGGGVMIIMNNNFEYKVERVKTDKNGNYIILDVDIQGKRITLENLYGPNQDNPNFYTNIKQKVSSLKTTR